jgi:hypothetical protein
MRPGDSRTVGRAGRASWLLALAIVLTALLSPALAAAPALAGPAVSPVKDRALIDEYAAIEGSRLGVPLPGGSARFITLKESPHSVIAAPGGPALGATGCTDATGATEGPAAACVIELAIKAHTSGELRDTVAHEVFHAFQAVMSGTLSNFNRPENDWLIEGSAQWVESDLISHDRSARIEWKHYLRSPATQLFKRRESAIGFFAHMASSGISPWTRFSGMFGATDSPAAWLAGVGVAEQSYLDSEASAFFREPGLGPAWDERGPNLPSSTEVNFRAPTATITRTTPPRTLTAAPYADTPFKLVLKHLSKLEPLVEVTVYSGAARVHSTAGGSVDEVLNGPLLLCGSTPKACECPTEPANYQLFRKGDLALAGGSTGGRMHLVRRKPCEVLLTLPECQRLLPGFNTELSMALGGPLGQPGGLGAQASQPGGSTASNCSFLTKGSMVGKEFVGVIAPIVLVVRSATVAGAIHLYSIVSRVPLSGYVVSHPRIGDEATLATRVTTGPMGPEYSSLETVRVHNLVVSFSLVSTPGNEEANAPNSLSLLAQVAAKL